jgi:hypothetical protein
MKGALQLLLALALLAACRPATAVITSNVCYQRWTVDWRVATVGPIFMCGGEGSNSTVTFKWNANEDHGVFQIPTDACPSSFTGFATDQYKELAAAGRVGEFTWQLPTTPGDYWVTSQANSDCTNGGWTLPAERTGRQDGMPEQIRAALSCCATVP